MLRDGQVLLSNLARSSPGLNVFARGPRQSPYLVDAPSPIEWRQVGVPPDQACPAAMDIPVLQDLTFAVGMSRTDIAMPSRYLPAIHLRLRLGRSELVR
jgi:hypothetical protein